MKRPIDTKSLLEWVQQGGRAEYLFFWGHTAPKAGGLGKHCLSQWWPATFEVEGVIYPTAEHFMMAEKARLFGDEDTRQRILHAPNPGAAKRLGREVRAFDESKWNDERFQLVVQGNHAKFSQNPELRSFLINTGERVLVEASPVDRIWGIGLSADDPHAENPEHWRGLNLLGFALMEVRYQLQREPAS